MSLIFGVFVGILYDIFKLARLVVLPQNNLNSRLMKKRRGRTEQKAEKAPKNTSKIAETIVVATIDLSFCLLLCPIFCVFTYITVNGRFRWFIFVGAFIGALTYKITLGRPLGVVICHFSYLIFRFRGFAFNKLKIPLKKLSDKIKLGREAKRRKREENAQSKRRKVVFSYGKGG